MEKTIEKVITKKRVVIFLSAAVLIGVASLFVEVSTYRGDQICGYCDTRQALDDTAVFVFGASLGDTTYGKLRPTQFLIDFPEHNCDHAWGQYEGRETYLWNSPLIMKGSRLESLGSRSAIVARYDGDAGFREGVKELLAAGTLSKGRLLELAKFSCMDGGTCQMHTGDPGDAALLKLISK